LYEFVIFPMRTTRLTHIILLDFITIKWMTGTSYECLRYVYWISLDLFLMKQIFYSLLYCTILKFVPQRRVHILRLYLGGTATELTHEVLDLCRRMFV
jgi:hypothetical protein